MGYKVIAYFTDLQDFNHAYNVGDTFPRAGLTVTQKRLDELSGSNNRQHKPLIQEVRDDVKYTKSEINRMSTADLQNLADAEGIENARNMTGSDLKKILVNKYGL